MKKNILFSHKLRLFITLFTILLFHAVTSPAFSAETPIARLTQFSGTVMIKSQGDWGVQPVADLPLYSGDKLVTKIGEATITFNDGAVMEIRSNSNLLVLESEEEETALAETVKTAKRRLRLLLGKMFFKTGRGSRTNTTLETTTMVCGLRGTAGVLSIDAEGQSYIQFTEGGGDTVGNFISGEAMDVPSELADLNPAQRAVFVAVAAAQQAASASERAATGDISDAEAALAQAQAAEAAAQEAKTAAEQMLSNPDPAIQGEAAQAISAAEEAIEAAKEVQEQAKESGATGAGVSGGEGGDDVEVTEDDTTVGASPPGGVSGTGSLPKEDALFDVDVKELFTDSDTDLEDEDRRVTDTIPPVITINAKPTAYTNQAEAYFEIVSDADKSITYKIDGGTLNTIEAGEESNHPYMIFSGELPEGKHQILITANDEEGPASTASWEWTVDKTPPVASFSSKPSSIANTASFGLSATDANAGAGLTYKYSLDGGSTYTAGDASLNLALTTDGVYQIYVKAFDAAGNASNAINYSWTFDKTPPALMVENQPVAFTKNTGADLSVFYTNTEPGTVTYTYTLNGSTVTTTSLSGLVDGQYTFSVKATDQAGNSSPSQNIVWTVDTTAPVLAINNQPASFSNTADTALSVGYSNTEPGAVTYTYTLNGSTVDTSSLTGLADGEYTFSVTAKDQAGNSSTSEDIIWTVDTIAPVLSINNQPASLTTGMDADLLVEYTNPEPGTVTFAYTLNGASVETTSATGLADGAYSFVITATDQAGNITTSTISWEVDTLGPTGLMVDKTTSSETIDFALSSNDAHPGVYNWTLLDGSGTVIKTGEGETASIVIADLGDGNYTFEWTAIDVLGNSTSGEIVGFTFDTYQMAGGTVYGTGSVITGTAEGQLSIAGGDDWGDKSISIDMTGEWSGAHTGTLSLASGGPATGSTEQGIWLSTTAGTITGTNATGTSKYTMLTPTTLITGAGDFTGTFLEDNTWTGAENASDLLYTTLSFSSVFTGAEAGHLSRLFNGIFYEGYYNSETPYTGMMGEYDYEYFVADSYFDFSGASPVVTTDGTILFGVREHESGDGFEYETIYFPIGNSHGKGIAINRVDNLGYPDPWTIGSLLPSLFTNPSDLGIDLSSGWKQKDYDETTTNLLARSGDFSGIMGGTGDPLSGAAITLLGNYTPWDGNFNIPSLFYTQIVSSEASPGMAYGGLMFGSIDSSVTGGIYALYVSEDGSGGILGGSFTGLTYPGIGMWNGAGTITAIQTKTATGLTPDTFNDAAYPGFIVGWLEGDFGTSGSSIESEILWGRTLTLEDNGDIGIFGLSTGLGNYYNNPASAGTWTGRAGGYTNSFGSHDFVFWMTDEISGVAGSGKLAADITGHSLSLSRYTDVKGTLIGNYDQTLHTWSANIGGYWSNGQDLNFSGEISGDLGLTTKTYMGYGSNSEPYDHFNYEYVGLTGEAWSSFYDETSGLHTNREYFADGTYTETIESTEGSITHGSGTWGSSGGDLLAYLKGENEKFEMSSDHELYRMEYTGNLDGVIGGFDPLWSATSSSPADIVMMGELDPDDDFSNIAPSVFNAKIGSVNPMDGSGTMWSEAASAVIGAYSGYSAGITLAGADDISIQGNIIGLYVDNSGNAGYLRGAYSGAGYMESRLWEAAGTLYPDKVASSVGIAPANFMVAQGWGYGTLDGRLGSTGFVGTGEEMTHYYSGTNMETISIIDETTFTALPWGAYSGHYNGIFNNPENAIAWTSIAGGYADFGAYFDDTGDWYNDEGVFIGSTASPWTGGMLSADFSADFISSRKMGTMNGNILGTYDNVSKYWQAVNTGTWSGTDLLFYSEFDAPITHSVRDYVGRYSYTGGGEFQYSYSGDNRSGYWEYRSTPSEYPYSYRYFNSDGSTTTYQYTAYDVYTVEHGTWDPETQSLADIMSNPSVPSGETAELMESDEVVTDTSSGYLYGLMGGTVSLWSGSNIPFTLMGSSSGYGMASIWNTYEMFSENVTDGSKTTYDGGAYYGAMAGIKDDDVLKGMLAALYIAPDGSAGVLTGNSTGIVYPGIDMFKMEGTVNRAEMASNIGIGPETLYDNVVERYPSVTFAGDFSGTGSILTGEYYYSTDFQMTRILDEPWGIYSFEGYGEFENPGLATTFNSQIGGSDYSGYMKEYFLANTSGTWSSGVMDASMSGKILSETWLATLSGDLLGTYSGTTEGLWEAVSFGTYSGSDLMFSGGIYTDIIHAVRNISGNYSITTGSGTGSYSYNFYEDNSYGHVSYTNPDTGYYIETYYNSDGTKDMYDSLTGEWTEGTWNPAADSLASLISPTPPDITGYEWTGSSESSICAMPSADLDGLMGGATSLWTGIDIPVTLMGSFYEESYGYGSIWRSTVYSKNAIDSTYTAYDGGAYYGAVAGIKNMNNLEGLISALYIAPDGSAGYLTGGMTGYTYPDIEMFEMDGIINRSEKVPGSTGTGIAPEDLYYSVEEGYASLGLAGSFEGTGQINTGPSKSYRGSYALYGIPGQPWGVYSGEIYGSFENPGLKSAWNSKTGGWWESSDGSVGFVLADTSGTWDSGRLSATMNGRFITETLLGDISGDSLGTYSGTTEGLWEAVSLGTYIGAELKFLGALAANITHATRKNSGDYNTATGYGYYEYWYYEDNTSGYVYYTEPETGHYTSTHYYSDGTKEIYDSSTGEYTEGAWNPGVDSLASLISESPPAVSGYEWSGYSESYVVPNSSDNLMGLLGGTTSLWTESVIPFTLMGSYYYYSPGESIWYSDLYSWNSIDETYTTYDGGAYYGAMAGIRKNDALEGRLIALYIAPDGSAGYLTGNMSGFSYPSIEMFEMDGTINRAPKATDIGIAPKYLEDYVTENWTDLMLSGDFEGTGSIKNVMDTSYYPYSYYYSDNYVMSGIAGQPWGIYSGEMYGAFENPGAKTAWSSRIGGSSWFPGEIMYTYVEGSNIRTGAETGSVDYEYSDDNSYGYRYVMSDTEDYSITYNSDGSYSGYNYNTLETISGTWNPETENIRDIVTAVPSEWGSEWENSYEYLDPWYYDHQGYILANTSSTWTNGKLGASMNGRFISETLLGNISGEILGTYSGTTEGLWEAVNLGKWEGTALKYAGDFYESISHAVKVYTGSYSAGSTGFYSYSYHGDNSAGYVEYTDPGTEEFVSINYYLDGTKDTYNSSTGLTTPGTWIPGVDDLASLISTTPPVVTGFTWEGSSESYLSYLESGGMDGLMGGTGSLWTGVNIPVTLMGTYGYHYGESIWSDHIQSRNFKEGDYIYTTYDNGAYYGIINGIGYKSGEELSLEGNIKALYIDPAGKAGFLVGSVTGTAYSDISMFEMDGTINRYNMVDATKLELTAADLSSSAYSTWFPLTGSGTFGGGGTMNIPSLSINQGDSMSIEGEDWGIWSAVGYGEFSGTTSDDWTMSREYITSYYLQRMESVGSKWSDGKVAADVAGAWVTINNVQTGILGGELDGTFNPAAYTWENVSSGAWMETSIFLNMAATEAGRATLEALNIPCVEIGKTTLTGTDGTITVNMNDVAYFAYSTGADPRIWATGDVNGSFSSTPVVGASVGLTSTSGGTLSATFDINAWESNIWEAGINGSGTLNRTDITGTTATIELTGDATGNYTGDTSGTFSGTGAGVVK